MIKLIREGSVFNTPQKEYVVDSPNDIKDLPANVPFGSYLIIIKPFDIRIYNSSSQWVSIIEEEG